MKKINQQKGFTLIELVVVIVVTGVLAAVAAPKFMGVSSEARQSAMAGVGAALKSQINTTHAKSIMDQNEDEAISSLVVENTNVAMAFGYPNATEAAINALVDLDGDYKIAVAGTVATITYDVSITTNCTVVYTAATSIASASAVTTTSGC